MHALTDSLQTQHWSKCQNRESIARFAYLNLQDEVSCWISGVVSCHCNVSSGRSRVQCERVHYSRPLRRDIRGVSFRMLRAVRAKRQLLRLDIPPARERGRGPLRPLRDAPSESRGDKCNVRLPAPGMCREAGSPGSPSAVHASSAPAGVCSRAAATAPTSSFPPGRRTSPFLWKMEAKLTSYAYIVPSGSCMTTSSLARP